MSNFSTMLFKKIDFDRLSINDIISKFYENEYKYSKGEGFTINELGENVALLSYIYQSPTYIQKFNEDTLSIEKEKILRKNIVYFSIDIDKHILAIYSNSNSANRLTTEIGKNLNFKYVIKDIQFSPKKLV